MQDPQVIPNIDMHERLAFSGMAVIFIGDGK
jgi:hypothetical protein